MCAKRRELTAIAAMGALYFFSYFYRVGVPGTVFDEIQTDLGVSAAAVTALAAIYLYVYGGIQIGVGLAADLWGGMKVLIFGGLLMSAGGVIFPLSGSLGWLYASRAMVGMGAGCMYLSIVKEIDSLFGEEHFAPLLGVMIFVGYAGGLMGTYPLERAVSAFGWRRALLGAGVLCTATLAVVAVLLPRLRHIVPEPRPLRCKMLTDVLAGLPRSSPVLFCGVANWAVYFIIQTTLGKKFLQDFAGLSSRAAAGFTFLMMVVAMTSVFFSGIVSRLMGNRRKPLLVVAATVTLAACVLLVWGVSTGAHGGVFLAAYLLLAAICGSSAIFCSSVKELNAPESVGLSVGVFNCAAYVGVAIVANAAGLVLAASRDRARDTGTAIIYPAEAYETIFWGLLVLAALSVVVSLFIRETHGRSVAGGESLAPCGR